LSYLTSFRDKDKKRLLTDEEIVDNAMVIQATGHGTPFILITFMGCHLAGDPDDTLTSIVQGT
jgi:cytochrome P450